MTLTFHGQGDARTGVICKSFCGTTTLLKSSELVQRGQRTFLVDALAGLVSARSLESTMTKQQTEQNIHKGKI